MTMQEVIENELKCVQRDCCRLENECAKCDLVLPKEEIINAYNKALRLEKENTALKQDWEIMKNAIADYNDFCDKYMRLEKGNAELKAQIEKMKDCLNKWYKQHNDDYYTETFYDNLLRDTEKCLWGDSVND